MKPPESSVLSIKDKLSSARCLDCRLLRSATACVAVADVLHGSSLSCDPSELWGRSILLSTREQLSAALALMQLDGIAGRIIICPPDTPPDCLPLLVQRAKVDTLVSDYELPNHRCLTGLESIRCDGLVQRVKLVRRNSRPTEWVLLSSGTTGVPKMIVHTLSSLLSPIEGTPSLCSKVTWGTFYDIRRYGGLQILLRTLIGGGSLLLSDSGESTGKHLTRLREHGATHISGTPSQWRRALMSPEAPRLQPSYIRLSGEIVDQGILEALHSFFPDAAIGHAFASTEAGVGFEVNDGFAGFPVTVLDNTAGVEIRICNDSLRIRSNRTASRYLNGIDGVLADPQGFVDTGDIVERRGDRYYFLGRRNGVINVGGLKVYPEEVEAVINCHPAVRMSMVRPKRNPITGSLVVADIILDEDAQADHPTSEIKSQILETCRRSLAHHKVPAIIRYVTSLQVAAAGKLSRDNA